MIGAVWKKCGKMWKIYPINWYDKYRGYMDYRTDNDWVYRSYNLISRILILTAVDNGSGKGCRNGT